MKGVRKIEVLLYNAWTAAEMCRSDGRAFEGSLTPSAGSSF